MFEVFLFLATFKPNIEMFYDKNWKDIWQKVAHDLDKYSENMHYCLNAVDP